MNGCYMKPHGDAIAVLLMLGGTPHDIDIDEAFKEADIDRNAKQFLLMMGYIRDIGEGPQVFIRHVSWRAATAQRTRLYTVTPKGLELLE